MLSGCLLLLEKYILSAQTPKLSQAAFFMSYFQQNFIATIFSIKIRQTLIFLICSNNKADFWIWLSLASLGGPIRV